MLRCAMATKCWRRARSTFAADGKIQTENVLFNAGAAGAKTLQFSIDPLPGETNRANNAVTRLVNVESTTSAASCMSRASRAGNTSSSAARRTMTASSRSSPCSAPPKTRSTARASRTRRNWQTAFPRSRGSFRLPGADHRVGGSRLLHAGPAGIDPAVRGSPRRRFVVSRRAIFAGGWRLGRLEPRGSASRRSAEPQEYISPRSRHRRTDARGRRQHHFPAGGRSQHATLSAGKSFPT